MRESIRSATWTWSETEIVRWDRGSRRQDRWIAMTGVRGWLHIAADGDVIARIYPLLRLGAATHVGADIAFGCGRYRIAKRAMP
jgi:CRISPR-associated endoribonuclease Cas6